jgi:branched-chain amino acid transport system substrate-binding protein
MTTGPRHPLSAALALACWLGLAGTSAAQPPLRIGASMSQTGSFAALGQNQLRGYQLCVKHANDKGGVLGRRIELLVEDDRSDAATAVQIYEKLIAQEKVDAILGPYSSPITEATANVSEKYRLPMIAPLAATTSIFKKGRKFVFMVLAPAEVYLEGLIDMAARRGFRTVAVINEDTLFPKASAQGTVELAKKRGLQVVLTEAYPKGSTDFSALLTRVRAANPDVLAAATYFDDAVALTRQSKELNVNLRMYGVTVGGDLPRFYETLGRTAEFVYGSSQWEPELVTLRAGGLIPVARQYPGAREFVDAYRREYPGADLSYHSAGGYAGCELLLEGIRRAGSLNGELVRAAILKLDLHTIYGSFKVDADGFQVGKRMVMFQWQDGKKAIVWPEDLAPEKPRIPTPPWTQRQ